jgi:replication initiation and membrane attachment protein
MDKININDLYTLSSESIVNSYDRKILNMLYQPIIGYQAFAVYLTLYSEVETDLVYANENRFERIIKVMNIDLNTLQASLDSLEGISLVKTYHQSTDDFTKYHFKLFAPKSADRFFKDLLLVSLLKRALDDEDFLKTKLYFRKEAFDLTDYTNITNTFTKVYGDINQFEPVSLKPSEYKGRKESEITGNIDFDLLSKYLDNYHLAHILKNQTIKYEIERIALTYNIDLSSLADLILQCSNTEESAINFDELKTQAKLACDLKQYKNIHEYIYFKNSSATNKYDKQSVYEFASHLMKTKKISDTLLQNFENILRDYQISNGIFNVIFEYSYNIKKTINTNYIKTIISDWQNKGIDNVNKALKHLENIKLNNTPKQRGTYAKYDKKVIGDIENLYQDTQKELSEAELKELEELVKG